MRGDMRAENVRHSIHAPHLRPKPRIEPGSQESRTIDFVHKPKAATWPELHGRALERFGEDTAWLADFTARVGGNCACRKDWRAWIEVNPPDWADYFGWTVLAHNAVNKRLGKPEITVDQARVIWTEVKSSPAS